MIPLAPAAHTNRVVDKRIVYGAFALFVLLTFVGGLFLFLNLRSQAILQSQVNRSQQVIRQLDALLSTLQDAELGQRGYLLTSNETYLEPYNSAVVALPTTIKMLDTLIGDNSTLRGHFSALLPLVQSKMRELQSTVDLQHTQSAEAALALVNSNLGKNVMDQIRSQIAVMSDEKNRELVLEQADVRQFGQNTFILAVAVAVLNLAAVGIVFVLLNREIRERRQTEAILQRTHQVMAQISDLSPTMIYVYAVSGEQQLYFNQATADFLGLEPAAIHPKAFLSVFSERLNPDDLPARVSANDRVKQAADGEIVESEIRLQNTSFDWRWLYCRETVFRRNAEGKPVEIIGTAIDITARKLLQEHETERADILRSFIESASHDLNTPITILTTSIALMKRYCDVLDTRMQQLAEGGVTLSTVAPEIADILQRNRRKVQDLEVVVGLLRTRVADMLEMVRIEQEAELALAPVDFKRIVEYALEICRSEAEKSAVSLRFTSTPGPLMVRVDEERMTRALNNLIFNAIHYNHEHGMVEVRLECTAHQLVVEVIDDGVGIAEEDLSHIFERFYRADKARSMASGGSGLGLPMTREIIERHGGQVTVTSRLNEGTTARILLPDSLILPKPRDFRSAEA